MCAGSDGVVVSADSRGAWKGQGGTEEVDKLMVVGERVVVAAAGLLVMKNKTDIIFDHRKWVSRIVAPLGPRPRAAEVARALERGARRELPRVARHRSLQRAAQGPNRALDLFVAGFSGTPELWQVHVDLGQFAVERRAFAGVPSLIPHGFAPGHLDDGSPLWGLAARRIPSLRERRPTALAPLIELCGLLLGLESTMNPVVGLPVRQAIVRATGSVERRVWQAPPDL